MKKVAKKKIISIVALTLLMILAVSLGVLFGYNTNKVKADTPSLVILDGISIKLDTENDVGGMRFEAQMDTSTAQEILDKTYKMYFAIAPTAGFDYYYNQSKTFVDMANDGNAIKITVDKDKIYPDDADNPTCYYAQACIKNIQASNRNVSFEAGAYIVNGESETVIYTERNSTATGTFYDKTNKTIISQDEVDETAMEMTAYNEWYGTEKYPVMITTQAQYNKLVEKCNNGNETFKNLKIGYTSNVSYKASDFTDETTKPADMLVTHTVTFKNGETTFDTAIVRHGKTVNAPKSTPERSGTTSFEFYNWYIDDEEWNFETDVVTSDIILNAKYMYSSIYASYEDSKDNFASSNLTATDSTIIPQSYALAINLKEAVSNSGNAIAFATKTTHSNWVNVKFDMYVSTLADKTGWIGGFKFATSIGDNYSICWQLSGGWTRGAWNTIEIKKDGNGNAQYWVNDNCLNTGSWGDNQYFYICLNPGDGDFLDTDILLIDNLVMQCDGTTYTDTFDNKSSTLLTGEHNLVESLDYKNLESIAISTPNGNAIAINLKTAVSNYDSKVAFATTEKHIYSNISFDFYMPEIAKATAWLGTFTFKESVVDNYQLIDQFGLGYLTKNAWNHVEFKFSGTTGTMYVNGVMKNSATISSNATYFYICVNPGNTFEESDNILIDNLSITDTNGTTFEDFNNMTTTLLTASHNLLGKFDYVANTYCPEVKKLDATLDIVETDFSGLLLTSEKYDNITSINFEYTMNTGFGATWAGFGIKSTWNDGRYGWTDSLFYSTESWGRKALTVGVTYKFNITISGTTATVKYIPKDGGTEQSYNLTLATTTGNYLGFFNNSSKVGSYTVENFSMVADGKIYSGMQLFNYGSLTATHKTMADYSFSTILASGKIEEYFNSTNYASISAIKFETDAVATEGTINYTLTGSKEFAIKVGMVDSDSVYIVVVENSIKVYVGNTLKKEITLSTTITYKTTNTKKLLVNDVDTGITLTSLLSMQIVGFGGEGIVEFNSILIKYYKVDLKEYYYATIKYSYESTVKVIAYDATDRDTKLDEIKALLPDSTAEYVYSWNPTLPDILPLDDVTYTIVKTAREYSSIITYTNCDVDGGTYKDTETIKFTVENKEEKLVETKNKIGTSDEQYIYNWVSEPTTFTLQDYSFEILRATNYYTVSFDTKGGSGVDRKTAKYGDKITKPTNPTKTATSSEIYSFSYWCDENGDEWDFDNDVVTENITLMAVWEVASSYVDYDSSKLDFSSSNLTKVTKSSSSTSGYALSINLKDSIANNGTPIAFATREKHSNYVDVSFDMYVPALANKTSWLGGFKFATTIGNNYSKDDALSGGWIKASWNHIQIKVSDTSAQYWINGTLLHKTATCPSEASYFYICINPGDGSFDDTDIMYIDNFVMKCDNTTLTDNFDNQVTLHLTPKYNLLNYFGYSQFDYALAVNLKDAVSNKTSSIAIATTSKHSNYTNIKFDMYLPALASKYHSGSNVWWIGFKLGTSIGDNYSFDKAFNASHLNLGAWNTIELAITDNQVYYYINGYMHKDPTTYTDNSYFYFCIDPGDGSFDSTDILLVDNLVMSCDDTIYKDDFNAQSTSLLTASHSSVSSFSYQAVGGDMSIGTVNGNACAINLKYAVGNNGNKIAFVTREAHNNYSNISFDLYMPLLSNKTSWIGGFWFSEEIPTTNYPDDEIMWKMSGGFTKGAWNKIEIKISSSQAEYFVNGQSVYSQTVEIPTNASYFYIWLNAGDGSFLDSDVMYIDNLIMKCDSTILTDSFDNKESSLLTPEYSGLNCFDYVVNTQGMENYSFDTIKSSGKIEEYFTSNNYASISSGDLNYEVQFATGHVVMEGIINYTITDTKEFAITLGKTSNGTVYIIVKDSGTYIYIGANEQCVVSTSTTISYEITSDLILISVNDTSVNIQLESILPIQIVGFGGNGSVIFNSVNIKYHTLSTYSGNSRRFTIAAYAGPTVSSTLTDEHWQRFVEAGFNTTIAVHEGWYDISDITKEEVPNNSNSIIIEKYKDRTVQDTALKALEMAEKYGVDYYAKDCSFYETVNSPLTEDEYQQVFYKMFDDDNLYSKSSSYKGNFAGDEPNWDCSTMDEYAKKIAIYYQAMKNRGIDGEAYINLLPMYDGITASKYETYINTYISKIAPMVGYVSYDFYPLKPDGTMKSSYLYNLETVAKKCKEYKASTGNELEHRLILQGCGETNSDGEISIRKITSANDLTFQMYTGLAFGVTSFTYYEYGKYENRTGYTDDVILNLTNGTYSATYEYAKSANNEILGLQDVYLRYSYNGFKTYGSDTAFTQIASDALSSISGISSFSGTQATIMSSFKDGNNNDAYMIVNYTDPDNNLTDEVTITFDSNKLPKSLIVYENGQPKVVKLTSNTYSLTLGAGKGAFIIPLY